MSGVFSTLKQLEYYINTQPVSRQEKLLRLNGAWETLYWQAVKARNLVTQQYRGFRVGCAVLAFRDDLSIMDGRWRIFSGMNAKVSQVARATCAEPIAIGNAYARGYRQIIGIVVVGQPQQDEHSGLTPLTLHPCHHCRQIMRGHPLIGGFTRVLTAHPPIDGQEELPQELHSLRRLLKIHNEL